MRTDRCSRRALEAFALARRHFSAFRAPTEMTLLTISDGKCSKASVYFDRAATRVTEHAEPMGRARRMPFFGVPLWGRDDAAIDERTARRRARSSRGGGCGGRRHGGRRHGGRRHSVGLAMQSLSRLDLDWYFNPAASSSPCNANCTITDSGYARIRAHFAARSGLTVLRPFSTSQRCDFEMRSFLAHSSCDSPSPLRIDSIARPRVSGPPVSFSSSFIASLFCLVLRMLSPSSRAC